jgi:hypothetical protein
LRRNQSLELISAALALARDLDDRAHEADLLWHMAVRHAEAGRREDALSHGQAAVGLVERLRNPDSRVARWGSLADVSCYGESSSGIFC